MFVSTAVVKLENVVSDSLLFQIELEKGDWTYW